MAFRGYELNLMLRVQDRATARLRRLSQDIGGLTRASELQRRGARLAEAHNKNSIAQARTAEALNHRTNIAAEKRLGFQARMLRLQAQEITLTERLSRSGRPATRAAAEMRLAAVQKEINRLKKQEILYRSRLQSQAAEQLALERSLGVQIAANNAALARAVRIEAFQRRARLVTHAGSVAAMAGGLGLAISAGAASKFAEFNRQAVGAATQMRGVNESFSSTVEISGTLQTALLDLTRRFPASATEMADAIYDIASGMDVQIDRTSRLTETQQRFNHSFNLLKAANKVAVAGNLDLATATDVLITTFNNFDPTIRNQTEILDRLFAIVRFGKGTFAEFSPQIGRMASAANAAGQTLTEAGGALAFLSRNLPLSQATTALVRIFQIIGRKEFTTGFQELFRVSPFEKGTRQLKDLSELMSIIEIQGPKIWPGFKKGSVDLQNVLQNITAAGQDVIRDTTGSVGLVSTEFARRAITNFIIFGEQYRDVVDEVGSTQGEFVKSFEAFRAQPGVQWQIAINQFKAFAIIVGQDVIPVVLRFIDFVGRLAQRYEDLNPRTRELISQFATWGSIILLVGGAFTTIVGAIGILIGRMGGLLGILGTGTGAAGVLGRMGRLLVIVRNLAALGAIIIVLKTIWSGDASAKDFLVGALAGGIAGAQIGGALGGPLGAIAGAGVGAITVPIVINLAAKFSDREVSESHKNLVEKWQQENNRRFRSGERLMGFDDFRQQAMHKFVQRQDFGKLDQQFGFGAFVRNAKRGLDELDEKDRQVTESRLARYKRLAAELTGLDIFGSAGAEKATKATNVALAVARAEASGNEAALRAALAAQIAFDKAEIARMERLPKTAERVENLIKAYQNLAAAQAALNALNEQGTKVTEKANLAAEQERSKNEAKRAQMNKIEAAAGKLVEKYKELEQANKEAFEIFTGPISRGPIVQVFNNINQMLTGLGREPIPIPVQFQIQDIQTQVSNFKRFTEDLSALRKRGLPAELISELQAKGPEEGLAIVSGLRQAGQGAINQYVKFWKEGQQLIKTTTDRQMQQTLKQWQSYGKDIAWAIVQGLSDEKSQATLRKGYEKYITSTFKSVLAKELAGEIDRKVQEFKNVQTAKTRAKTKSTAATTPEPTRTTQSVTNIVKHGDQTTIRADGATPVAVKAALDRHAFDKRHRN